MRDTQVTRTKNRDQFELHEPLDLDLYGGGRFLSEGAIELGEGFVGQILSWESIDGNSRMGF